MTWTCEQVEARLSDYLDGLLELEESHELNQHVNSCETCSLLFATVSRTLGGLYSLEAVEPPPRLVYAILNQTLGPRATQNGWRGAFGWINALASARFAYSAVSVVATLLILLTSSGFSFRKAKLADLSPASLYRGATSQAHIVYAKSAKFVSDLRVVYEIQSRLNKGNELPTAPESTIPPQSNPAKNPGSTDGTRPATPRQQNRANGLSKELEVLAAGFPGASSELCGRLCTRRIP